MLHFDLVKIAPPREPPIPGFSIGIVLSAALIVFLGVIYNTMRKTKDV